MRLVGCAMAALVALVGCTSPEERARQLRSDAELSCLMVKHITQETDNAAQAWFNTHRGVSADTGAAADSLHATMAAYGDSISKQQGVCDAAQRKLNKFLN